MNRTTGARFIGIYGAHTIVQDNTPSPTVNSKTIRAVVDVNKRHSLSHKRELLTYYFQRKEEVCTPIRPSAKVPSEKYKAHFIGRVYKIYCQHKC